MNIMCELVLCMQFFLSFMLFARSEINEKSKNKMEKYEKIKMIIYVIQLIYVYFCGFFSGMRIIWFQSTFQLIWIITSNVLCVDAKLSSTKEVYFLWASFDEWNIYKKKMNYDLLFDRVLNLQDIRLIFQHFFSVEFPCS